MSKKVYGTTKKIDDLGRVCIPKEYRKVLDIRDKDLINISIVDDKIVISKSYKSINYENEIRKYIYLKYGNAYMDYFISGDNVKEFENLVNNYVDKLIDKI